MAPDLFAQTKELLERGLGDQDVSWLLYHFLPERRNTLSCHGNNWTISHFKNQVSEKLEFLNILNINDDNFKDYEKPQKLLQKVDQK